MNKIEKQQNDTKETRKASVNLTGSPAHRHQRHDQHQATENPVKTRKWFYVAMMATFSGAGSAMFINHLPDAWKLLLTCCGIED